MPSVLEMVAGKDIAKSWKTARNKHRAGNTDPAKLNVFDAMYGATVAAEKSFRAGMTTAVLATPGGQSVVAEAERSRLKTHLRNPAMIFVLVVVVSLIFFAGRR